MGKNKQKGPGKGKKESAVSKVAGVRKPKIKSVNTNLKKVRGGGVAYNWKAKSRIWHK